MILAKRWQIAPRVPPSQVDRFPDLDPLMVQLLYNRGITEPADMVAFFDGVAMGSDPFDLPGVTAAVTRLRQALCDEEPIAIYGDFDADGVTATALMVQTLRALGGDVRPYIPNRVEEGYGLNTEALDHLAGLGVGVVVTVDCGIRSLEEADYASRLGLDMIITDHHSVGQKIPRVVAVIDPKYALTSGATANLAGVGVAFKLAQALLRSQQESPFIDEVSLQEEQLLDLVAIGTVADLVPLRGENRDLVRRGLVQVNQLERPGLKALCEVAGLKPGKIDTSTIGFKLGPRLNAAGRIADAQTAFRLLDTRDSQEAKRLAQVLDQLNRERQELTAALKEKARLMALQAGADVPLLFAADPQFQAGVVGLVANHLMSEFYRPAVVVQVGENTSRGSARSIPEFHITHALEQCADLLIRFGGHAAAAGFEVPNESLPLLTEQLQALAAEEMAGKDLVPALNVDAEITLPDVTWDLVEMLGRLEPCGYENPPALFLTRDVHVRHHRTVGKEDRHLKLRFSQDQKIWQGIAFRQGEWAGKLPDQVDIVYHVEVNEWRGTRQLQLNVQDIRPADGGDFAAVWLEQGQEGVP